MTANSIPLTRTLLVSRNYAGATRYKLDAPVERRAVKKIPAVLVCDAKAGSLKIAGLTVLDRLVVSAHRAYCGPITIVSDATPRLACAEELQIETSSVPALPAFPDPVLLIDGGVLVEPSDLERVIEHGGQLAAANGSLLPIRVTTPKAGPVIVAHGLAVAIVNEVSARVAERKFWASLSSPADGLVDRFFNRPLGRLLSKLLVHTSVSPNQVSFVSIVIGVVSAWFFARGYFVLGALVFQFSAVIDCVDGELARVLFKQSRLGKWLDLAGDQVVHFCVFAALGIGVARTNSSVPATALGASAALGVLLSFAVIIRALRRPPARRSPLLNRLLEATANRDFSVLLLALAIFGRIDLFLWMAGIGIHIFWIALLLLLWGPAHRSISATVHHST
ncbi:MAG: CDP-alcohol phosphatidyltransferase family protein [Verrucomicrobiota bacterium]|nr:CDP-alcohol phosphatidyltransferase family protein [Verrucomicrobiota bacterium]